MSYPTGGGGGSEALGGLVSIFSNPTVGPRLGLGDHLVIIQIPEHVLVARPM